MAKKAKLFTITGFSAWLDEKGAIIEPSTNEWEVLRFRTDAGVLVIHRNKRGEETWPTEACRLRGLYVSGMDENLSPSRKARTKLRGKITDLMRRDGPGCWYLCGVVFATPDDERITIEHLCALSFGGPNHAANLCLSCQPCNLSAGNLHVVSKVAIRDQNRTTMRCELAA